MVQLFSSNKMKRKSLYKLKKFTRMPEPLEKDIRKTHLLKLSGIPPSLYSGLWCLAD